MTLQDAQDLSFNLGNTSVGIPEWLCFMSFLAERERERASERVRKAVPNGRQKNNDTQ